MSERTSFRVGANRPEVSAFADAFAAWCEQRQVPERVLLAFQAALDDVLVNIIDHGGAGRRTPIDVEVVLGSDTLEVEVVDDGIDFDPLRSAAAPDLGAGVEQRPIGGLGVHLVRRLMDDVRYRRERERNHLTLTKRLGTHPEGKP